MIGIGIFARCAPRGVRLWCASAWWCEATDKTDQTGWLGRESRLNAPRYFAGNDRQLFAICQTPIPNFFPQFKFYLFYRLSMCNWLQLTMPFEKLISRMRCGAKWIPQLRLSFRQFRTLKLFRIEAMLVKDSYRHPMPNLKWKTPQFEDCIKIPNNSLHSFGVLS